MSTSLSENSFNDTTCHDDVFSGQVASILFEGYEKENEDILNFKPRKSKTGGRDSIFSSSRHRNGSDNGRTITGRLQVDQRSRFLDNLAPETILSADHAAEPLDILDVHSEGDVLLVNDDAVYTWNPLEPSKFCNLYEPNIDNVKSDYVQISCAGWHDSARLIATGTTMTQTRGFVTLTNLESSLQRKYYDEFELESSPLCIQWNRTGVTCGCEDGGVYHYDDRCRSNKPVLMFNGHCMPVMSCRYNKAGDLLATGDFMGDLLIWDKRQPKEPVNSFREAHAGMIVAMSWCPWQQDLLATGNARQHPTLKFWNLNTGLKSRERRVPHEITSVQWLETERELISSHMGTSEGIVIWKYPSLKRRGTLRRKNDGSLNMGLIKKSSKLVSISEDHSMYVWNLDQSGRSSAMMSQRRRTSTVLTERRSPFQLGLMR
eukprot:XP_011667911.1 PREDICTED: anaphase-promoting complex subunit cdc20-like [Strongylocentrotus purpuratus]